MVQEQRLKALANGGYHVPIFFIIVGIPFVIVILALVRPQLLEQIIREPPSRTPPP